MTGLASIPILLSILATPPVGGEGVVDRVAEQAQKVRRQAESMRERLEHLQEAAEDTAASRWGVHFLPDEQDGDVQPPPSIDRLVLLVHGLDDPGTNWRDLAVALRGEGYLVATFEYPNDGPIPDAADRMAEALVSLRVVGVLHVDIVAHSMGGLVARDLLTRNAHYAGDGRGSHERPSIDRLVMLGTPNHGTVLAELRGIAEVREQAVRLLRGEGHWLGFLADGEGQAAIDLQPDSTFLADLNTRPLASHTRHTIIAARLIPMDGEKLSDASTTLRRWAEAPGAPAWASRLRSSEALEALADLADTISGTVGDGLVTLDSVRLDGVEDFEVVDANHLSMILHIGPGEKVPPSIPIILDRLSRPLEDD